MKFSSARNAWLRSPNPSNANNERNVNTDGSLNNNNAINANAVAPDCEKCPYQVVYIDKSSATHTRSDRPTSERREYYGRQRSLARPSFYMRPLWYVIR